jgi:hypothetical protein
MLACGTTRGMSSSSLVRTVEKRVLDGCGASVFGQEAGVQIEHAERERADHAVGQEVAKARHHAQVKVTLCARAKQMSQGRTARKERA